MGKSTRIILFVISLLATGAECSPRPSANELACDSTILRLAWGLLSSARFGVDHQERAAFIVRQRSGDHVFRLWPSNGEFQAAFRGELPPATVAIIHTHPKGKGEYPSMGDRRLSARVHLPVYVLTRTRISKARGATVETIWEGDWDPEQGGRFAASSCVPIVSEAGPESSPTGGR